MSEWNRFLLTLAGEEAVSEDPSGRVIVSSFLMREMEYGALQRGVGLTDRSERGLIEITGTDRLEWCHNLTTNQVRTLQPGDGVYAFGVNLKGRIVFDVNVLVREDALWLDLDRCFLRAAQEHLSKYIITEDVELADRGDSFVRLGLAGPKTGAVMSALGASQAVTMPWLGHSMIRWEGIEIPFMRNDFCGPVGVELFVPADRATSVWKALSSFDGGVPVVPAGLDAVEVCRIEAGILRAGREIDEGVVVGETLLLERAVSFTKGCYLGQEVVERMRSRGSLARCVAGLEIAGTAVPAIDCDLVAEDQKTVGRITSACDSIAKGGLIALGYVRTTHSEPGTPLTVSWGGGSADAVVSRLPFTEAPG